MLSCHNATRLLSEAQERPLRLGEKVALKPHLMLCRGCRTFGQHMGMLRQFARAYRQGADERAGAPSGSSSPGDKR